jgi:anhydro-N-acetylmuramic acid kinase
MVYKVIGLMSGSSLDGLDIAYVHLQERAATGSQTKGWDYTFVHTACYPYPGGWRQRLANAAGLSAMEYQLLHTEYGHYLGQQVLQFIQSFELEYQVQLIASHGHTAFHLPGQKTTAQLGDGAAIAAVTRINVVSDLRSMDLALGGQGAPIVPVGELLLLPGYEYYLNLGGIANLSRAANPGNATPPETTGAAGHGTAAGSYIAFDVCPANRVLNELAALEGKVYDEDGGLAAGGKMDAALLAQLNSLSYYTLPAPKSLDNKFGTDVVMPLIRLAMESRGLSTADALRTYVEHIAIQISKAAGHSPAAGTDTAIATGGPATTSAADPAVSPAGRLLVTGGGAHNSFLLARLRELLGPVELAVPEAQLIDYKEALVMALIGVLRWREERNVLASVTGASRDSIAGAVYIGQEG